MKVCHMTSAHPEEDIRIFHKECVSLSKAGFEVYLVERGKSYDKDGVHIVGVGEIPKGLKERITKGAKMVYDKALSLDCDIYHFHDPELLPYGLKLKRLGKKVVFDSHELTREQILTKPYLPKRLARIVSKCYAMYENHALKKLDAVIFPCLVDGEFPLKGNNQTLINNVPMLSEMYDRYDPGAEKTYDACMVGSLSYARGITHMINASIKAGCGLEIGGLFTTTDYEKEARDLIKGKNVRLLGKLNREEVYRLIQHSKIGISVLLNVGQYSHLGNLPTKAYEYMSLGVPVILTRTPFNSAMVEKYGFGVCVDPENLDEFAEAIKELVSNTKKAKEMGRLGREAIKNEFSWEMEVKKIVKLYHSL